jgi:hypothetical protein
MIRVATSDGQIHQVSRADADMIGYLKQVEQGSAEAFPISNVDSATLLKVLSFCQLLKHVGKASVNMRVDEMESFVAISAVREWCESNCNTTQARLQLSEAASFLDFPILMYCCCQLIADSCRSMSLPEMRKFFGLPASPSITQEEIDQFNATSATLFE